MESEAELRIGEGVCFLISPIGEEGGSTWQHFDRARKELIEPVAARCGLELVRADQIAEPGVINFQIIEHIDKDEIVIADLSEPNANVFYELAWAHGLDKRLVLMKQPGQKLPFDVTVERAVSYTLDPIEKRHRAQDELEKHVRGVRAAAEPPQSLFKIYFALETLGGGRAVLGVLRELVAQTYKTGEAIEEDLAPEISRMRQVVAQEHGEWIWLNTTLMPQLDGVLRKLEQDQLAAIETAIASTKDARENFQWMCIDYDPKVVEYNLLASLLSDLEQRKDALQRALDSRPEAFPC